LDAVGILTQPANQAAKQIRLSVKSVRKNPSVLRPYESVEEAMRARQLNSSLSDDAARLLCERSLEHTGDYYQWRTDPRLNWRSPQWFTDDQILGLLAAIRAATLVITSPAAIEYLGEGMLHRRLAAIADSQHVTDDGHHHFHMEQPERIGIRISEFLQANKYDNRRHDNS
jgi:pimeloyl-ACP methyl ester carboxylesterase